jgi:SAM-dependent methyltransferase
MDRAHAAGITGLAAAFGRLGRTSSGLRFTTMPHARAHRWRGAFYLAARDADRRTFNARFGTNLLTEAEARRQLATLKAQIPRGYREYAPIDFGGGLSLGRIASTDSGTGRWDFFNGRIVAPLVAGKRVLDLGCNNGSLTLMMLRAGASEVVAIELTSAIAEIARLNGRILSWRDACRYKLDVINGDMRLWLTSDFGAFDVITAFCSLYYLPTVDMVRIIRKAAGMGSTLVLQANEAIENLPARARELRELMSLNGYGSVEMFSVAGFARPLLVGTRPEKTAPRR